MFGCMTGHLAPAQPVPRMALQGRLVDDRATICPRHRAFVKSTSHSKQYPALSPVSEARQTSQEGYFKEYSKSPIGRLVRAINPCVTGVKLPGIVVVGNQSSGKSTLLQTISRIKLPAEDAQLATRCPLRMNMHNSSSTEPRAELSYSLPDGSSVGPLPLKLDEVPAGVQQAQAELTSKEKPISETLLQLEIWAPGAPELALTDLPGLTENAREGEPEDLPRQIEDLVRRYTSDPETVIMCVCEGSLDPATHKAPALASKADPDGLRTFIVLTKPDLMPPDNFWELVTKNKDRFKSRVGVVRSRASKEANTSHAELENIEGQFINSLPSRPKGLDQVLIGALDVSKELLRLQKQIFRSALKGLEEEIRAKKSQLETKLGNYPDIEASDGMDGIKEWLSNLNTHLFKQLGAALGGRALEIESSQSHTGSSSSLRTLMILSRLDAATRDFIEQVDAVGKAEIMLQEDVKDALQSESAIRGGNSPLVHPEVPISVFQKRWLQHIKIPAQELVDRVRHLTKAAIKAMMARQLPDSFVDIHNILMDEVWQFVDELHDLLGRHVENQRLSLAAFFEHDVDRQKLIRHAWAQRQNEHLEAAIEANDHKRAVELTERNGELSHVMVPGGLTVLEAVRKGEKAVKDSLNGQVVGIQRAEIEDIWEIQMKLAAHTHMAAEDLLRGIPLACRHIVFLQLAKALESGKIRARFCKRAEDIEMHMSGVLAQRDDLQRTNDQLEVALSAVQEFKHDSS